MFVGRVLAIIAILIGVLFASGVGPDKLMADPGPTPTPGPPAAPTFLRLGPSGVLVWTDNSDNEDGFRILVAIGARELEFEVGPNITSFDPPPEARIHCPDAATVSYRVSAFNAAGTSAAVGVAVSALCGVTVAPTVLPTSTPAPVLPPTGTGPANAGGVPGPLLATLVGAVAAALALASFRHTFH